MAICNGCGKEMLTADGYDIKYVNIMDFNQSELNVVILMISLIQNQEKDAMIVVLYMDIIIILGAMQRDVRIAVGSYYHAIVKRLILI